MKIAILGVGAFGSVLANHFKKNGHEIISDTARGAEIIFVCVPALAVVPVLEKEKENIFEQKIVICSKGFTKDGFLFSEKLNENFKNIFFLYGPNLAQEFGEEKFSAAVLAGGEGKESLKKIIESPYFKIELSDDILGVQIAASLKNVFNIFVGLAEGLGSGQNTQAYIFTKSLEEMQKFGIAFGTQAKTFSGLASVGDLFLFSRNRLLGVELGKGKELSQIVEEFGYSPEGIESLKGAKKIAERMKIKAPMTLLLYRVLFENYSPKEAIGDIFSLLV